MAKSVDKLQKASGIHKTLSRAPSQRWKAPEVGTIPCINPPCDVWSFGMVMLEIFTLKDPFKDFHQNIKSDESVEIMVRRQKNPLRPTRPVSDPARDWITDDVWALMEHCWKTDPEDRPKMEEVYERLRVAEQFRKENPLPPLPESPKRRH